MEGRPWLPSWTRSQQLPEHRIPSSNNNISYLLPILFSDIIKSFTRTCSYPVLLIVGVEVMLESNFGVRVLYSQIFDPSSSTLQLHPPWQQKRKRPIRWSSSFPQQRLVMKSGSRFQDIPRNSIWSYMTLEQRDIVFLLKRRREKCQTWWQRTTTEVTVFNSSLQHHNLAFMI